MYSDDLDDIDWSAARKISSWSMPIQFDTMIEHRGFFPCSLPSQRKAKDFFNHWDIYQWYRLPSVVSVQLVSGLTANEYFNKFDDFISFKDIDVDYPSLPEGTKEFLRFPHLLAEERGESLFRQCGGMTGFTGAEAIVTLGYGNSFFLFLSLNYKSIERRGTGQYILGLELTQEPIQLRSSKIMYTNAINIKSLLDTAKIGADIIDLARKIL